MWKEKLWGEVRDSISGRGGEKEHLTISVKSSQAMLARPSYKDIKKTKTFGW
jgi:hypothetical protein